MSPIIEVLLLDPEDGELLSRFRNLGEAVYSELADSDHAAVDLAEIDQCWDHFFVRDIRKRHIGTVTGMLDRLVRQHGFKGSVTLQRVD